MVHNKTYIYIQYLLLIQQVNIYLNTIVTITIFDNK